MRIILYHSSSETNRIDKTSYLEEKYNLEGYLRSPSSLTKPVIDISTKDNTDYNYVIDDNSNQVSFGDGTTPIMYISDPELIDVNYCYIPDFNRYYFIDDPISINTNLWRLILKEDVLMSYKNEILNTYAFVARNEFTYHDMIKDDEVSYYYDKDIIDYVPDKGDLVNQTFNSSQSLTGNNIAITCINEDIGINLVQTGSPVEGLPNVNSVCTGDGMGSITYATYGTMISRLSKRVQDDDTNESFIISIMSFPFQLATTGSDHVLKLGDNELSSVEKGRVEVRDLDKNISQYYIIADFTIENENGFFDYEPYSQYEIYIPYLGYVPLSADLILGNRIIVYYVVNYQSGGSQVTIYDTTNQKILYTGNCQLGTRVSLSTTNQREVNDQRNSNNIGLGVGLLTSALSITGGIATGNPIAVAGGVISGGNTISRYIQNNNTNYQRGSGQVSSGQSGLYLSQDVRVRITKMKPKNYNEDYAKLRGKPLNQYLRIGTLTGYTLVGDVHLENFSSATLSEINEISTILLTGFII